MSIQEGRVFSAINLFHSWAFSWLTFRKQINEPDAVAHRPTGRSRNINPINGPDYLVTISIPKSIISLKEKYKVDEPAWSQISLPLI